MPIPILASVLGLVTSFRMLRQPDPVSSGNARSKVGAETTAQLVWILAQRLQEPEGEAQADDHRSA